MKKSDLLNVIRELVDLHDRSGDAGYASDEWWAMETSTQLANARRAVGYPVDCWEPREKEPYTCEDPQDI